jgi:hypothetical protein
MSYNRIRTSGTLVVDPGGAFEDTGPVGLFLWDKDTDYGDGLGTGYKNGERVYKSYQQHPDGIGGTSYWYKYYNDNHWLTAPSVSNALLNFTATLSGYINVTFTFSSGTVDLYINGSLSTSLTTATTASVLVAKDDVVDFVISVNTAVTVINMNGARLLGDVSQFAQFSNLASLTLPDMEPVGHITDVELLTNSYFPTDLTGWTEVVGTSWEAFNSSLRCTGNSQRNTLGQSFSNTIGNVFVIEYRVSENSLAGNNLLYLHSDGAFYEGTTAIPSTVGTHTLILFAVRNTDYDLRLMVESSSTSGTITIPYVSVKAITNLVANGGFDAWTGDNPDGWSVIEVGDATSKVTENPAGACQIISTGAAVNMSQEIGTIGNQYRLLAEVTNAVSGGVRAGWNFLSDFAVLSAKESRLLYSTSTDATFSLNRNGACNITIGSVCINSWPDQNIGGLASLSSLPLTSLVVTKASSLDWTTGALDGQRTLTTITLDAVNWTVTEINEFFASCRVASDAGAPSCTVTMTNMPRATGQGLTDITYLGTQGWSISIPAS